jgi:hypothetical protein
MTSYSLEIREYGRRDPSRWPRGTLYPQKPVLSSPTSGGCLVGIVRSRTQATEFFLCCITSKKAKLFISSKNYTLKIKRIRKLQTSSLQDSSMVCPYIFATQCEALAVFVTTDLSETRVWVSFLWPMKYYNTARKILSCYWTECYTKGLALLFLKLLCITEL